MEHLFSPSLVLHWKRKKVKRISQKSLFMHVKLVFGKFWNISSHTYRTSCLISFMCIDKQSWLSNVAAAMKLLSYPFNEVWHAGTLNLLHGDWQYKNTSTIYISFSYWKFCKNLCCNLQKKWGGQCPHPVLSTLFPDKDSKLWMLKILFFPKIFLEVGNKIKVSYDQFHSINYDVYERFRTLNNCLVEAILNNLFIGKSF